jgi:hypothetical protein
MSYTHYRGRCAGRLMAFLYTYSHRADSWFFYDKAMGKLKITEGN